MMKKREKKTSRFRQFVRSILIAIAIIYGVGLIIYTINNNNMNLSDKYIGVDTLKKIKIDKKNESLKNKLKEELEKIKNSDIKKSGSNK
jgi:predicted membrane protein